MFEHGATCISTNRLVPCVNGGMAWFRHKDDDESMDPQVLLARADAASPTVSIAKAPAAFRMTISDVFSIKGRGTVVTGTIEAGSVDTGDTVRLTRADGSTRDVTIEGIEAFRKILDDSERRRRSSACCVKSSRATTSPAATSCPADLLRQRRLGRLLLEHLGDLLDRQPLRLGQELRHERRSRARTARRSTTITQPRPIARCEAGNDSISA